MKKQDREIVDYNNRDFRVFWRTESKKILDDYENRLLKKIIDIFFLKPGWFIDIGCGFGRNLDSYYSPDKKIILIDFAMNHLEMARDKYSKYTNIYYIAADAYNLPLRSNSIDNGIIIRLFHHLTNEKDFFSEMNRIFKTNSKIILTFMNKRNFFRIFRYGIDSFKQDHSKLSSTIYGTHTQYINKLLRQFDFKKISTYGSGFLHQLTEKAESINSLIHDKPIMKKIFTQMNTFLNFVLGKLDLSLIQFVFFKKIKKTILTANKYSSLESLFICPHCQNDELKIDVNNIYCLACNTIYPVKNNIYDFRLM